MAPNRFEIASIILFVLAISSPSLAEDQAKLVLAFEQKVELFQRFYSSSPKLCIKEHYSKSPTGYLYIYSKHTNAQVSYDIQKTDSIISPFAGYILVEYDDVPSDQCGDVQILQTRVDRAFSAFDSARENRDNPNCYGHAIRRGAKWIFASQKGKWVFKVVLSLGTPQKEESPLGTMTSGKSLPSRIRAATPAYLAMAT
jgi:hypothetical protein